MTSSNARNGFAAEVVLKIIAIAGGAQRIGRCIAFYFAKAGYGISLADPHVDAGREALESVRELGADVALGDEVERWMARILATPTFAKIAVRAAKRAERRAHVSHPNGIVTARSPPKRLQGIEAPHCACSCRSLSARRVET